MSSIVGLPEVEGVAGAVGVACGAGRQDSDVVLDLKGMNLWLSFTGERAFSRWAYCLCFSMR